MGKRVVFGHQTSFYSTNNRYNSKWNDVKCWLFGLQNFRLFFLLYVMCRSLLDMSNNTMLYGYAGCQMRLLLLLLICYCELRNRQPIGQWPIPFGLEMCEFFCGSAFNANFWLSFCRYNTHYYYVIRRPFYYASGMAYFVLCVWDTQF